MYRYLLIISFLVVSLHSQDKISGYQESDQKLRFTFQPTEVNLARLTDDIKQKKLSYYDESRPGELALPSKSLFVAIPPGAEVTVDFRIIDKRTEDFNPSINPEASLTRDTTIQLNFEPKLAMGSGKKEVVEILGYFEIKGVRVVHLKFNQYDYNFSSAKLDIISKIEFTLNSNRPVVNYNSGIRFSEESRKLFSGMLVNPEAIDKFSSAVAANDTTGNWIDYSASYVKIGVAKDGIYRVFGADLQSMGVNLTEIQPATLQLLKKGTQQDIFVFDGADNQFDVSDYIEFLGERNMGSLDYRTPNAYGIPYNEYYDRFTDTTIYWITWNRSTGKRVPTAPQTLGIAADTLKAYTEFVHQEQDRSYLNFDGNLVRKELPYFYENKTFYWQNINAPTALASRSYTFSLSELDNADSVRFYSRIASGASSNATGSHSLVLQVGNNFPTYDSSSLDRYGRIVLSGTAPGSLFANGNNTIKVISYPNGSSINTVWIDWVEMEYIRKLKATNDSLAFNFLYSANSSVKNIEVTNVTSDSLIMWKKGGLSKKIFVSRNGGSLVIQDTVSKSDRYFLVKNTSVLKPTLYYKKTWKNLRNTSNRADYLAVTVKNFLQPLRTHLGFIKNTKNLDTFVVDIDDVYDEFAYGYFSTEALRDFLRITQTQWQAPYPDYLLLAGSAAWDYRLSHSIALGIKFKKNLVPSYGSPLSDNLLSVFDSTNSYIPQLITGRIPAKTIEDLNRYLSRISTYYSDRYDLFNKRALLLSGGGEATQMDQFRLQHENIANSLLGRPYSQNYNLYYKTETPPSFYGPFPIAEVDANIKLGGVFISYVGHSGTFFWDNGVTTPSQLQNSKGKGTIITDFGCSTGRFGEPDVDCFGEQFTLYPTGTAVGYISNSSYGFTSTATLAPQLFYESILKDSIWNGSAALRYSKVKMIQQYGNNSTNQLFAMTNTYFGDPALEIKLPPKANFFADRDAIKINSTALNDNTDSVSVSITYYNYGTVPNDTLSLSIMNFVNGVVVKDSIVKRVVPEFRDSLELKLPIKGLSGDHRIRVRINSDNRIQELYSDDNEAEIGFLVAASTTRDYLKYTTENVVGEFIYFLNPGTLGEQQSLTVQFAESPTFDSPILRTVPFDTFYTKVPIDFLQLSKRYYFRVKDNASGNFGAIRTFYKSNQSGFGLYDSLAFYESSLENLEFTNNGLKLADQNIELAVGSAGYYDGNSAYINYKGNNIFVGGTALSHNVAVFKAENMELLFYKPINLTFGNYAAELTAYKNILDTLDESEIIVITTAYDPIVTDAALRTKLKEFGSVYIDSVKSRDSWFMIGRKNAPPGSVPEQWKKKNTGMITYDTTFVFFKESGRFTSNPIGPVTKWNKLKLSSLSQDSAELFVKLIGLSDSGAVDTTDILPIVNGEVDLSNININSMFNRTKVMFDFQSYDKKSSKILRDFIVTFDDLTEVGTNVQSVQLDKDTLKPDELISGTVKIFNASTTDALNFNVKVYIEGVGSSPIIVMEKEILQLVSFSSQSFPVEFRTPLDIGSKQLIVSIDPERKLKEYFTDNNVYRTPFYIIGDTSKPILTMKIDGEEKPDGEFVSSNPRINIEFFDFSSATTQDTTLMQIFLNGSRVFFASPDIGYTFQNTNPKMLVTYQPTLKDGSYDIQVIARGGNSGIADTVSITKNFAIINEPKLLDVYNYPNPFSNDTYFTFKLTQIPEELKVMVFTVAGRKIKEMVIPTSALRYDLNKIYWDGRDQDGDLIANGVYFYRIVMKKSGKTEIYTEKLAIIK